MSDGQRERVTKTERGREMLGREVRLGRERERERDGVRRTESELDGQRERRGETDRE